MAAKSKKMNKRRPLRLACWNANGIQGKKIELKHFIYLRGIDVCLVGETHLKLGQVFRLANYVIHCSDRPTTGGASAILVHRGIEQFAVPISNLRHLETTAIHLALARAIG